MRVVSVVDQGSLLSTLTIPLRDLMGSAEAWGEMYGLSIAHDLQKRIEAVQPRVVRLSLAEVSRMDVSFATEMVRLASYERACCGNRHGFCLVEAASRDVLANWRAAAHLVHQPLFVWQEDNKYSLLGPTASYGLREVLSYVLETQKITTSAVSKELNLKVPNVSNKLNALWRAGYILRIERSAESGGIEYEYWRIA